ncbi:VapC toxin family PIN domain ribonuclease [Mycobacterium sp.]|uniref:VapC toxin family PIN domain ribonuclease n=1 Tax=Mycobacterium sp. TaxID=1785 RepID=UPI003A889B63
MIYFLADSSAIWRIQRQPELTESWTTPLLSGAIGSCAPQRAEFQRSARNTVEFDEMSRTFADLYPDVPVPQSAWRWIEAAQYRLASVGAARALSVVDLLLCATAADRGLVVLHDDADFEVAERHLPNVSTQRVIAAAQ